MLIYCVFSAFYCSARMEDFLLIIVLLLFIQCEKNRWELQGFDGVRLKLGLQVSFFDKQNLFALYRLLTVVVCIFSHFVGVPANFCVKHHVYCDCQYPAHPR